MKQSVLIGQVASLAQDIVYSQVNLADFGFHINVAEVGDGNAEVGSSIGTSTEMRDDASRNGFLDGVDTSSRRVLLNSLLGEWEQEQTGKFDGEHPYLLCQWLRNLALLGVKVIFTF